MAVTAFWYHKGFLSAFNKEIDINSDTLKCALTTSTYSVSKTAHDYFNDITNEVSSTNYTAGGVTLTNAASAYDASSIWNFDCDDPAWTTVSFTTRYGVYYDAQTGVTSTDPLISYLDFGGDQTVSSANFTITVAATGVAKVTVS